MDGKDMKMTGRATNYTMEELLGYKAYIAASEGSKKQAPERWSPIRKGMHLRVHILS
jgi:hypothetical protein